MPNVYTPEQEEEIAYSLEKLHYSPIKYCYCGDLGVKHWFQYEKLAKTQTGSKGIHILEKILLTQKADTIFNSLFAYGYENINIIDIGVGDSTPTYPIFQYLQHKRPNAKLRYNGIDISSAMLHIGPKNVASGFKVYGRHHLWDIESRNFSHITKKLKERPRYGTPFGNLFMFLGSVFGNMMDKHQTLVNIRESMGPTDYFILGVEMIGATEQRPYEAMRDYYNIPSGYDLGFTVLEYFGARHSYGKYSVIYNKEQSRLEAYFTPNRSVPLKIAGKEIVLKKGDPIKLFNSTKFTQTMIADLLSRAGFRIEMMTTYPDSTYALILAQPSQ